MRVIVVAGWLVASACGDNIRLAPDAPPPVRPDGPSPAAACIATLSGNFAETDPMSPDCGVISGQTMLAFSVPSPFLATTIAISFDLGATPMPGTYSSESVATWNAMATEVLGTSRCYYVAGATAVPPGDFTMTVASIDARTAHGQLALQLAVLPGAETDCGMSNAEMLDLTF